MKIENCLLFRKVYFIEQIEMMLDQRYTDRGGGGGGCEEGGAIEMLCHLRAHSCFVGCIHCKSGLLF